ncbi:unnamed protein product [Parascedosporium putredinis]|uniref:Neutral ceramidase n=1 Tax=Parascedosporium putredinis TaxID=1442378 RepID=A0A9P1HE69_9PEZI|nr:unnamed protein product [Parascedosporium putredinis]CAI8004741.1 unnamed protein product [Parascedosporium putredinis]
MVISEIGLSLPVLPLPTYPRGYQAHPTPRAADGDKYLLGVGKGDITGPVVEINFAGYADTDQVGSGLRQRLYSRAFIIGDKSKPADRFVYLVIDTASGDTAVRNGIVEGLKALGGDYAKYYNNRNIAVTGTHSHAGPGGWWNYLLPQVTSLGFDRQGYQAIVDGAVLSIKRAHDSSPRAISTHHHDAPALPPRLGRQDDGRAHLVPVHGTSLLQNNTLVAGDNKGVAAWLLEREVTRGTGSLAGTAAEGFVAGFSQANVGTRRPTLENSTCADGLSQSCHGRGPEFRKLDLGVSSCFEIGRRQFAGALSILGALSAKSTPVVGPTVKSFHFYHDMAFSKFRLPDGTEATTCPAALGYSRTRGSGRESGVVRDFGVLRTPSAEQKKCQEPKPILFDVGEMSTPYAWSPNVVDVQVLRVGQLVVIVSPGEATTMAGRRWREAVGAEVRGLIGRDPVVVLGGPANTYSHYITTREEFGIQRYEGASTLYGQHTLAAYINLTVSAAHHLAPDASSSPAPGPSPPDNRKNSLSFITGPAASYARGATARAVFVGANPRNNLRLEGTYAAVERLESGGQWRRVRGDGDWFLVYSWKRKDWLFGTSEVTLEWYTGEDGAAADVQPGTYRFKYYGDSKSLFGCI